MSVISRPDLRRAVFIFQAAGGKSGNRALLAAIIGQAALDLADGDHGAAAYFLSDLYRGHLQYLDLPDDLLPAGVTAADLRALANGRPKIGPVEPQKRAGITRGRTDAMC